MAAPQRLPYPVRPIEVILRDRERRGYGVIADLRAAIERAALRPSTCRIVLGGPDALALPSLPAAVDFLREELGFVFEGGTFDAASASGPAAAASLDGRVLRLPAMLDAASVEWVVFGRRCQAALALIASAERGSSALVTVRVHSLCLFEPPSAPFRLVFSIEWRNELGTEQTQAFPPSQWYDPADAVVVAAGAVQPPAAPGTGNGSFGSAVGAAASGSGGTRRVTTPPPPAGAVEEATASALAAAASAAATGLGAPATMLRYHTLLEVFPTLCDGPATLRVAIWRKRPLIDKLCGRADVFYDASRPLRVACDVHSPDRPTGLPVGRVTLEADSLALRCAANEAAVAAAQTAASEAAAQRTATAAAAAAGDGAPPNGATGESDHSTPTGATRVPTPPLDPLGYVDRVVRPPDDDGVKYDADDYF